MSTEEILNGNKLIAEFMGYTWSKEGDGKTYLKKFIEQKDIYSTKPDQLQYNSSWNWLMPVVEKIEHLYEQQKVYPIFEISVIRCRLALLHPLKYKVWTVGIAPVNTFDDIVASSKIEALWMVIIEFIKYYNENEKENKS